MTVEIRTSDALALRLRRDDADRPTVSFLIGAPFSLDQGQGVPNVDGFLGMVRARVADCGPEFVDALTAELDGLHGADAYRVAMSFVYGHIDAAAVADIVEAAVGRARRPEAPPLTGTVADYEPGDWYLTRAQRSLALAMNRDPARFSGPIFTTNFDPLMEIALKERGFEARTTNIALDGAINAPIKLSTTAADVYHLHGFWRESATLHAPEQLLAERPQLLQSLQRHLDNTHLVVMAYSGWDDIFTTAIANCLNDPGFRGTLSWCFFNRDPVAVRAANADLFAKFAPGIAQGRIAFYGGVDCHTFFDDLIDRLGLRPAAVDGDALSPMPGWQIVDGTTLATVPPLTDAEAVRFFDGAIPTLRHAVSPLIPRLSHSDTLVERFATEVADGGVFQLVRAAGGEGKSTVLMQAAVAAAQDAAWTVLYRPGTDAKLNAEVVASLDPARNWLIVADDADTLIDDLWSAANLLSQTGRGNVSFLLAARDTDWLTAKGDAKGWNTRLRRLPDVTLTGLEEVDARRIVEAWRAQGNAGLRDLNRLPTADEQVARLHSATRAQGVGGEGSFFGGLLATRFGAVGLVEHLLPLLEPLREQRVVGGTGTLFDALLYIASYHATDEAGLERKVLAKLCGIPLYQVSAAIIGPLGRELGAAESRGHVLTRHKSVAEAIVVASAQLLAASRTNFDLTQAWRDIVIATAAISKDAAPEDRVGETYSRIVFAGSRLHSDLPAALSSQLRNEIAVAAAEAAHEAIPEWSSVIAALAKALRSSGDAQAGVDLLKRHFRELQYKTVDWEKNYRGYVCEWATCYGQIGGEQARLANAWLGSISLSDRLPVSLSPDQARKSFTGLAHAYDDLWDGNPQSALAKGHRAIVDLGRAFADRRLSGILAVHRQRLADRGVADPSDLAETITWLRDAATAAWGALDDRSLRNLKLEGQLSFERLTQLLKRR